MGGFMRKIWIDCDPGIDDGAALIFLAANKEKFEILGISTVAGNQTIEKVTENALNLIAFLHLDIPVVKGARKPLQSELVTRADIHGESGLGKINLPKGNRKLEEGPAVEYIYRRIMELPEEEKITYLSLGPLTNLAVLLQSYPQVKERLEEIIFMGGAAWGGNVTAAAEFNVYTDPEAASIVLNTGIPTVMCGLDVTKKCGLTRGQIAKLCQGGGTYGKLCGELMGQMIDVPVYQVQPVIPIHDAVPFMYMLHPEIFGGEKLPVEVDCSAGIGRGQTICDCRYLQDEEELSVKVLLKVDKNAFQEYFIESLFELDEDAF